MDILTKIDTLVFCFKETGNADFLFKISRELDEYLNSVIDDYAPFDDESVSFENKNNDPEWTTSLTNKNFIPVFDFNNNQDLIIKLTKRFSNNRGLL